MFSCAMRIKWKIYTVIFVTRVCCYCRQQRSLLIWNRMRRKSLSLIPNYIAAFGLNVNHCFLLHLEREKNREKELSLKMFGCYSIDLLRESFVSKHLFSLFFFFSFWHIPLQICQLLFQYYSIAVCLRTFVSIHNWKVAKIIHYYLLCLYR